MINMSNQQKFMALIFAIYIPTHLLAFYVYYNPPKDAWYWVEAITTVLPQLGGLMEFKKMPLIGARLAFMFAVTYVPMHIVGLLLAYHSSLYGKKVNANPKKITLIFGVTYFALVLVLLHYLMYRTSYGKGYLQNSLHPAVFAATPLISGIIVFFAVFVTLKFFQSKQK